MCAMASGDISERDDVLEIWSHSMFYIFYSLDSTEIIIISKLTHLPYDKGKNNRNWTKGSNEDMILVTYLKWFSSHRTLPVGLIAKHSAKITDNIYESKYEATWKFKFR